MVVAGQAQVLALELELEPEPVSEVAGEVEERGGP